MNYAYEIQSKIKAGLQLAGQGPSKKLVWMGKASNWSIAERYSEWLQEHKRLPNDKDGYREVEPHVFLK